MRYLNVKKSLFICLLINTVFVTCGYEQKCLMELLYEFKNENPIDDFLIAFLNIKYIKTDYSYKTMQNEDYYEGYYELKHPTKGYYLDMFYTLDDMDLPSLMGPQAYCYTEYEEDGDACISDIAKIGCKPDVDGFKCLKHLYIHWKKTMECGTLPGTEFISDKKLLEAIYKGSEKLRHLSHEKLLKKLSEKSKIIDSLSDENLLKESGFVPLPMPDERDIARSSRINHKDISRYSEYMDFRDNTKASRSASSSSYDRYGSKYEDYKEYMKEKARFNRYNRYGKHDYEDDFDMYEDEEYYITDFQNYLEFVENTKHRFGYYDNLDIEIRHHQEVEDARGRISWQNESLRQEHLKKARLEKYGIGNFSYQKICEEYVRRKQIYRSYDYYYTMYLYDRIKDNCRGNEFKTCTDYCETYVPSPYLLTLWSSD